MSEWISVKESMPDKNVLVCYKNCMGNWRTVKAFYANRFEVESGSDDSECANEYSEEKDDYFLIEGWFECIDNWGEFSSIYISPSEHEVTHWMPMPKLPSAIRQG